MLFLYILCYFCQCERALGGFSNCWLDWNIRVFSFVWLVGFDLGDCVGGVIRMLIFVLD